MRRLWGEVGGGATKIDWEDFVAVKWRFQNRQCCRVSPWWEGPTVREAFEGEGESVKRTEGERRMTGRPTLCTCIQSDTAAGNSHGLLHSFVIS